MGAVVGFATIGLVTNHWGRSGAGLFFAVTALFTLAANGARVGSEAGLTYFVARLRADGDHRSIPEVIGTALRLTGATATAVGVVGLFLAPALAGLVASDPDSRDQAETMIRILAVAVPLFAVTQACFGASRGFATMRPSVVAGQLVRPLSQLALVGTVMATTGSLPDLALAWAASAALALATIAPWLIRRMARVRRRHPDPGDPLMAGRYRRFAAGRAGADLISAALERLDVILVAVILGQAGAGLYGAAGRLILAGQLLMIAASQSMAPLLTAAFRSGRIDEARGLLRTITAWNVTLLWPPFLCLAFGAATTLSVFGPEFTEAAPLVVVLSLAMLVIVALGGGDTLLSSTGDSLASFINHVVALAVMIGSALVLLPTVGVVGAAWAWALSRLTLRGLATIRVWRTHDVHAIGRPVLVAAAAATVAYAPVGLAARTILGPSLAALLVNVAVGGVVHLTLLARLRQQLDLDRFLAVLTRRGRSQPAR